MLHEADESLDLTKIYSLALLCNFQHMPMFICFTHNLLVHQEYSPFHNNAFVNNVLCCTWWSIVRALRVSSLTIDAGLRNAYLEECIKLSSHPLCIPMECQPRPKKPPATTSRPTLYAGKSCQTHVTPEPKWKTRLL